MLDLAGCLDDGRPFDAIRGLWVKTGEGIVRNDNPDDLVDLDALDDLVLGAAVGVKVLAHPVEHDAALLKAVAIGQALERDVAEIVAVDHILRVSTRKLGQHRIDL